MSRIVIVQRRMTHYRVPFFEALREELAFRGLDLFLAHGDPSPRETQKGDGGALPWAHHLDTTYFLGGAVCWQPLAKVVDACDLVVLTHENKLINNLGMQFSRSRHRRVALWGHGANLQGDASSWREKFKRRTARQTDWWFGYTEMSKALIEGSGFPEERITVVNNAIDTVALASQYASATEQTLEQLCRDHKICGRNVGVFIGSLYSEKRIDLLLEAAVSIRERVPDFELLVAGDGPDRKKVESFCQTHAWARYLGVSRGAQKAKLLALAKVLLNPGGVGLGILDSFVCKTPIVTTDCKLHGPEIAYLENGSNGVMTPDDLGAFVDAVERVVTDHGHRSRLEEGCAQGALAINVESMARRFCDGVQQCLAAPIYRWRA